MPASAATARASAAPVELRKPARPHAQLRKPYLLFLGDVQDKLTAKTAFGLKDWCADDVVGRVELAGLRRHPRRPAPVPAEAQRAAPAPSSSELRRRAARCRRIGWPSWQAAADVGPRRGQRPAYATDLVPGAGAGRLAARRPADRRAAQR